MGPMMHSDVIVARSVFLPLVVGRSARTCSPAAGSSEAAPQRNEVATSLSPDAPSRTLAVTCAPVNQKASQMDPSSATSCAWMLTPRE
jgi:hypothetical protein